MKSIKILFILVVGFLFSFGLLGFFVQTRNIDGRPWAASPNLADGFSVFTDQATKWANDHFFGRWFFLKQYNSIKKRFNILAENGFEGKDDWAFISKGSLYDYIGNEYSKSTIERAVDAAFQERLYFEKRGIKYYLLICPNKVSIYYKHLPDWVNSLKNGKSKFVDLFVARLMERDPKFPLIFPRELFLQHRDNYQVFPKRESHPSPRGAYLLYRAIIEKLEIVDEIEYPINWVSKPAPINEDMSSVLGYRYNEIDYPKWQSHQNREIIKEPIFKDKDRTGVWAHGVCELCPTRTVYLSSKSKLKIMVYCDSSMRDVQQFLGESAFETCFLYWAFDDFYYVDKFKPDIVIKERFERFMNQ